MSGYIGVRLGDPLQYDQRIQVYDFPRVLRRKEEIKTNLVEIFPGVKVNFLIKKMTDNQGGQRFTDYRVLNDQDWVDCPEGSLFFNLEIQQEENGVEGLKLAGEVGVNLDGEVETVKFGDVEKDSYQGFTSSKLSIKSSKTIQYWKGINETAKGVFVYIPKEEQSKTTLELKLKLFHPEVLTMTQELEVPRSLVSQEALAGVTEAIMQDEDTSDFSVRCEAKSFKAHKNFLCSRVLASHYDNFIYVPLQVSGLTGHDPRENEGGSEERSLH